MGPRAHQAGSAKGEVKAEVHAADATTRAKAATKAVTRQQQGAAEALVDPPAEGASLSANLHQKDGQLATEGLGSSRQNLYVVEGGRSSKSDANAETEVVVTVCLALQKTLSLLIKPVRWLSRARVLRIRCLERI